jgi:hypothetical protein
MIPFSAPKTLHRMPMDITFAPTGPRIRLISSRATILPFISPSGMT